MFALHDAPIKFLLPPLAANNSTEASDESGSAEAPGFDIRRRPLPPGMKFRKPTRKLKRRKVRKQRVIRMRDVM